ncbi:MAG: hypothetical protein MJE66_11370, partial [Proteobacteria bacterium]|nr:hypothetical protein [Pseudomonadota bacterium]
MSGTSARRFVSRSLGLLLASWLVVPAAGAFEAWDGRLQLHGFYEMQLRALNADYREEWDVSQWWNVLNLEIEADLLQDTIGPIDLVGAYARVEVRFDCIYSRGCGMFRSMNAYGDRTEKLPRRLSNAKDVAAHGVLSKPLDPDPERRSGATREAVLLERVSGFSTLADGTGPDQCNRNDGTCNDVGDDPFPYVFANSSEFRFTQIQGRGGRQEGLPTQVLGPWLPKNFVVNAAALDDRVNPFDADNILPFTFASPGGPISGGGANPFRPIPVVQERQDGTFGRASSTPRGLYLPSRAFQRKLESGDLESTLPFNLRQAERAWNRGSSQRDEKELKEAYLDIEMFDSRLWLRLGKQNIVWGKTELFRTTDQFNPQDLALASLPSLEESRIALWAFRAVYSFYEVGPLEDVRLELAMNFDQYETNDLGACGEPYTPNPVCQASFGAFAHGVTGLGLAGAELPDNPWDDSRGIEFGGRLEFRWDRFSFAISDFYGYNDLPFAERLSTYERNVDPNTGRPRIAGSRGRCDTVAGAEEACLTPGPTTRTVATSVSGAGLWAADRASAANNALLNHHANLQIFGMICSTTLGFSTLDASSCAQTVFGSSAIAGGLFPINNLLGAVLAGGVGINNTLVAGNFAEELSPLVALDRAGQDSDTDGLPNGVPCVDPNSGAACGAGGGFGPIANLSDALTIEQEALLGCGPFWGTNCDNSGIDLLNMDASVILQSFVGFEGTTDGWRTDDVTVAQPGTAGFAGGPVCTSASFGGAPGAKLPGCRGPGDPGYDPNVDGDPAGVGFEGAGQPGSLAALGTTVFP